MIESYGFSDLVYNLTVSYLEGRKHYTSYGNQTSMLCSFNSGVVQGSGLGPILYIITASGYCIYNECNKAIKYADDSYITIPYSKSYTIESEINHFQIWAESCNLAVNKEKTKLIIFHGHGLKDELIQQFRDEITSSIKCVSSLNFLGVTITEYLKMNEHMQNIVSKSCKMLYALKILQSKGMSSDQLEIVFGSTVISYVSYAINSWYGFCSKDDCAQLGKIIKRGIKLGYWSMNRKSLDNIFEVASQNLFHKVLNNDKHVLRLLLPEMHSCKYDLRKVSHGRILPELLGKHDMHNYILHMLYKH